MFPSIVAVAALAVPSPLTIGSPAPKFEAAGFVRGEPFAELARGTVYVVEFSGIRCAPCVAAMPVLTALQKKHPDVVFVSVYSEKEADVRKVIDEHDDTIGFRVALDRKWTMDRTWARAAGRLGIPDAYVVGTDGRIAWIGSPFALAGPLDQILAGTFDPSLDALRLRYTWAETVAREYRRSQEDRARKAHDAINQCFLDGRRADAAHLIDQALRDLPAEAARFERSRMYLWATDRATEDRAIDWAMARVVEMDTAGGARWQFDDFTNVCKTLLGAAEHAKSARLFDTVAVLVQQREAMLERVGPSPERDGARMMCHLLCAWMHAGKGQRADAARQYRRAIEIAKGVPRDPAKESVEAFEKRQKALVAPIEAGLAEVEKAASDGK